jgi:hypothetical protein
MEYKALFLDEDLIEIGNKKFQATDEFITYKQGTFNIRLNAYLYRNKDTAFYAYIYPTDEKMLIEVKIEPITKTEDSEKYNVVSARLVKIKEKMEKGDLKLIVGESIIGQLARLAVMGLKTNWILILIIAVAVGVGAGGGGYSFGLNNGINQGFTQAQHIINATSNILIPTNTPIVVHP